MNLYMYLRDPIPAALFAFVAVVAIMMIRDQVMTGKRGKNSRYIKPAFFIGILVYAIVYYGNVGTEPYLKDM
jgi:uncharacterized membrane protein (DUF4010 family)